MYPHWIRRSAFSLLFLACGAPAMAADIAWLGAPDCRIAALEPAPFNQAVGWDGACKDGYASGKGVLSWRNGSFSKTRLEATLVAGAVSGEGVLTTKDYTYTGTFRNGVPHGAGYFEYTNGKGWYEGEVAAGKQHGKGIYLASDRSRYAGVWSEGERNGWGEASFATGGSYAGGWKENKFHGQGRIVYAGSGRSHEGLFANGRVAGLAEPTLDNGEYAITERATGSRAARQDLIRSKVPLNLGWNGMTPAQKETIRSIYPALEAGDEPPFPVQGEARLIDGVQRINEALGAVEGQLGVHVLVGKDGKPIKVTTFSAPDPALVRAVSQLFMLEQFKPARCQGVPCEMIFPFSFAFSVAD